MENNLEIPNTFIGENGEMIFVEVWELSEKELDDLSVCERIVKRTEEKYGTNDIWKMIQPKNIGKKELMNYIGARRFLIGYGRY